MKWQNKLWIICLIALPIVLFILPKTQFDTGPTTCLITIVTGEHCMGCGMTRACMRLIHFDILGAMSYNKLSLIVFPILVWKYAELFLSKWRNEIFQN